MRKPSSCIVNLKKLKPGTSAESEEIKGRNRWFSIFRKRIGIHSVVMHSFIINYVYLLFKFINMDIA